MILRVNDTIENAYRKCAEITRQSARNFYYGLKLLPAPKRAALYSIYAWMRMVDDIADAHFGTDVNRRSALDRIRDRTINVLEGRAGDHENHDAVWIALACTAQTYQLDVGPFHAMIDGQLEDLDHSGYQTQEELREYCHRVASTVGLICIAIWGYRDDAAELLAIERGIAFQLTNMLRDFRPDYESGRVYLPRDSFLAFDLTPESLLQWTRPVLCRQFVMHHVRFASEAYEASSGLEELISVDCQPTLRAMTAIYHGLLRQISNDPKKLVQATPVRIGTMSKLAIALQARWAPRLLRHEVAR